MTRGSAPTSFRCCASTKDGSTCNQPAKILDLEQGGMVCEAHGAPTTSFVLPSADKNDAGFADPIDVLGEKVHSPAALLAAARRLRQDGRLATDGYLALVIVAVTLLAIEQRGFTYHAAWEQELATALKEFGEPGAAILLLGDRDTFERTFFRGLSYLGNDLEPLQRQLLVALFKRAGD